MSDMLRTSLSALVAFQRGLATTANNIANSQTAGYSRQQVELAPRLSAGSGGGFLGTGVDVRTITRSLDQFAIGQYRNSSAQLGRASAYAGVADQVSDIFGDPTVGVSGSMNAFFTAWQQVANNPGSTPARQTLLAKAQALGDQFRLVNQRLDQVEADINGRLEAGVARINQLSAAIARLNGDVASARAAFGGQPPNDLLDQRDQLVSELSQLVDVRVTEDESGALNVFAGNGQSLVLRGVTTELGTRASDLDPARLDIVVKAEGGDQTVTGVLTEGQIGGLLQVRSRVLDVARNQLGLAATAIGTTINQQQAAGFDQQSQLGAAMFSFATPTTLVAATNTGAASVTASVQSLAQLTGDDYVLRYDGSAWQLRRQPADDLVSMTGTGTAADPFVADGLSFVVAGGAASGDRFLVRGARAAAGSLRATLTDPRGVAAAAPIRSSAAIGNTGGATISAGSVVDASDPNLLTTVDIQFTSATTYSVNGAGSFTYTSGTDIVINGWSVQITGSPVTGDSFRVASNANGVGDNRNALLMAAAGSRPLLRGGTTSINSQFAGAVGTVATLNQEATVSRDAQESINAVDRERMLSASGVNLDEEAASLLRWQQAYQAAAKSVAAADTIFQSLLDAVRR
jgi:flagellar hook-associated protein 1 FlgK